MSETHAPRLSACLIVRDEAANLPRCLASLEGIVDEIVVVDTGSQDDTVAIAEAAGAKVGHFAWCDDFAAARNASLELATGDWALIIDADEELALSSREDLLAALKGPPAVYLVPLLDAALGRLGGHLGQIVRLFPRRADVRFAGRVHESVGADASTKGWPVLETEAIAIVHHGYAPAVMVARGKAERNRRLARLEVDTHPESALAWFQLGRSAVAASRLEEGLEAWSRLRTLAATGNSPDAFLPKYLETLAAQCSARADELVAACEQLRAPTLSVCMIVKDEAEQLPRCLASLRGIADELVVVDTGSRDATVAIAKAAGAKLGHFAWCDDFAAARNASLELATCDWVLVIDADEELMVADVAAFRRALAAPGAGGYLIEIQNLDAAGLVESRMPSAPRVFRRDPAVRFVGRLHEDVSTGLLARGWHPAILPGVAVRHHGYTPAMLAARDKVARNRRLATLLAEEHPLDPNAWQALASVHWLARDAEATLQAVDQGLALVKAGHPLALHRQVALRIVETAAADALGHRERALAALDAGLLLHPGHPELLYERGVRRADAGDQAAAIADFEACLAASGKHFEGAIRSGLTGFLSHAELGSLHAKNGRVKAAIEHLRAAQADPACPPVDAARLGSLAAQLAAMAVDVPPVSPPAPATPPTAPPPAAPQMAATPAPMKLRLNGALSRPPAPLSQTAADAARSSAASVAPGAPGVGAAPAAAPVPAVGSAFGNSPSQGRREELIQQLERNPRDAGAFLELGLISYQEQHLDRALVALERSLTLDASSASGFYLLGVVLLKLGQPRLADNIFRVVLTLDPEHPTALQTRLSARNATVESEPTPELVATVERLLAFAHPRLTACLIVRDEAVNLPRCLASLEGVVDEVVVVDTGSRDQTVAIAEAAGAKVGHFTWCDDFSAARNASLELATGDWVLVIDADEELVIQDEQAFKKALRRRLVAGYMINQINVDASDLPSMVAPVMRLFQRLEGIRFEGRVHESVERGLRALDWPVVEGSFITLRHTGYLPTVVASRGKPERNAKLAELAAQENSHNPANWLTLAISHFERGDLVAARSAFDRLDELGGGIEALTGPLYAHGLLQRAMFERATGNAQAAERFLDAGLARQPGYPEFLYERSQLRKGRGDLVGARTDLTECLAATPEQWAGLPIRPEMFGKLPTAALAELDALGVSAFGNSPSQGRREELIQQLERNPRDAGAFLELGLISYQEQHLDRALVALERSLTLDASSASGFYLLGVVLLKLGQPRLADNIFRVVLTLDPEHPTALQTRLSARNATVESEPTPELVATVERLLAFAHPRLTACLIVRDEAVNLPRCLASLEGVVDEVVVVDTGSRDQTVAIAEAAGAKVGHFPWCDDFSAARNASLELATGDWVLVIDADEELVIQDEQAFKKALRRRVPAGLVMALDNLAPDGAVQSSSPMLRLFQNIPQMRFGGRLHESLNGSVRALGWPLEHLDAARFAHHGYDTAIIEARGKAGRNMHLAELDLQEHLDSAEAWLNAGRSRAVAGKQAEALAAFEHLAAQPGWTAGLTEPLFATYVFSHQELLRQTERFAEAEQLLTHALARLPGFPDFLFERGNVRFRLGDMAGARADFEACLKPPPRPYLMTMRPGVRDELPRLALEQLDELAAARPKPLLSACLIVKDEAANLPRCLASLRGIVDELVVVDTGSSDETVALAEAAGARVGHFTWTDDFSAARNASLELATGEWALVIDADEELVVEDLAAFRAMLATPSLGGCIFPIRNFTDDGQFQVSPMLRLFRLHPTVRFAGRLHEEVVKSLEGLGLTVAMIEGVYLRHYGYLKAAITERNKWSRNLLIAIAEVETQPDSPLAWYNLARSSLFSGQREPARAAFAQVARLLAAGKTLGEAPYCNYVLLQCRLSGELGEHAVAEALLDEGLVAVPGFPEFHFERGQLRLRRGDKAGAQADFEACLAPAVRPYTAAMRAEIRGELPRKALEALHSASDR